jgi:hypothetical protein
MERALYERVFLRRYDVVGKNDVQETAPTGTEYPVFRIRIHLFRIRIQLFRLNTNPDPIRIHGFDDQK